LWHTSGGCDTDDYNSAVRVRKRRQYSRQFVLHVAVKRGFVLNSNVFMESTAKFLYIFERQIRNWSCEEHVNPPEREFPSYTENGKDDTPMWVRKRLKIAISQ
jgi:hypothetical protein